MTVPTKGRGRRQRREDGTYTTALAILGLSLELRGLFNVRLLLLVQKMNSRA
jgi:hypothetical protein